MALSNNRIVSVANDQVTFRYRVGTTKKTKLCTVSAEEFIRRFLQHVLPKGFVKVRYFGLFSLGKRPVLAQIRQLLAAQAACATPPRADDEPSSAAESEEPPPVRCPACGARMHLTQVLMPLSRSPPAQVV